MTKQLCCENGISSCSVRRIFGSFEEFFKELGFLGFCRKNIPKEDVLEDIKAFYLNHYPFSSVEYRKYGKFSSTVINRFGGWKSLLSELGIQNSDTRIGFQEIDSRLKELVLKYGDLNRQIVESNTSFSWNCLFWYFKNTEELLTHYGISTENRVGKSRAECLIIKILNELEIPFEKQKTFPWLINTTGEKLFLDFFFPDKNFAIEYDGQQHFKYNNFFYKTEQSFLYAKERDRRKNYLLEKHNIPLIRISYKEKITEELILQIYKQF